MASQWRSCECCGRETKCSKSLGAHAVAFCRDCSRADKKPEEDVPVDFYEDSVSGRLVPVYGEGTLSENGRDETISQEVLDALRESME